jgi:ribosome-binding protein aMBF1 (putative translation factor)
LPGSADIDNFAIGGTVENRLEKFVSAKVEAGRYNSASSSLSVSSLGAEHYKADPQVEAYERLCAGRSNEVVLEAVEDLPKALIRARIAAGMTQEGLARRLRVKPQQLQRYEATEYESASVARIRKIVQAFGLSMPKAVRLVSNG